MSTDRARTGPTLTTRLGPWRDVPFFGALVAVAVFLVHLCIPLGALVAVAQVSSPGVLALFMAGVFLVGIVAIFAEADRGGRAAGRVLGGVALTLPVLACALIVLAIFHDPISAAYARRTARITTTPTLAPTVPLPDRAAAQDRIQGVLAASHADTIGRLVWIPESRSYCALLSDRTITAAVACVHRGAVTHRRLPALDLAGDGAAWFSPHAAQGLAARHDPHLMVASRQAYGYLRDGQAVLVIPARRVTGLVDAALVPGSALMVTTERTRALTRPRRHAVWGPLVAAPDARRLAEQALERTHRPATLASPHHGYTLVSHPDRSLWWRASYGTPRRDPDGSVVVEVAARAHPITGRIPVRITPLTRPAPVLSRAAQAARTALGLAPTIRPDELAVPGPGRWRMTFLETTAGTRVVEVDRRLRVCERTPDGCVALPTVDTADQPAGATPEIIQWSTAQLIAERDRLQAELDRRAQR